jgi:hypothetical protein
MSNSNKGQLQTNGFYRSNAIDVLCVIVIVAYFLHFALPSLAGGFNEDEMMNLYSYWRPGALESLWANISFWKGFGRPAGALYYLPLYHFFSLNPQPYRLVQVGILTLSFPVVYYLARLLASSRSVAFLAVLALCCHAALAHLVFIGSFIYDVLCGFFYFAALTYYVYVREREIALRPVQLLGFLALYVFALNSKEMAVTLPLIVLIYEALKRPRFEKWKQFVHSNWRFAIPALIAGLLTIPYIYGKTLGSNALARVSGYRPSYSWHRFTTANAHFLNEVFYLPNSKTYHLGGGMLLATWAAVFAYAFLRRDRMLQLMAFWIVITPLPLAFVPLRGGACLYIPLFGWAMVVAKLVSDLIRVLSKSSMLVTKSVGRATTTGGSIGDLATNGLSGGSIGALIGASAGKMPSRIFQIFATILVASALAIFTQWRNQRFGLIPVFLSIGQKTSHVIQAFRSLDIHPSSGSVILLKPESRFYQQRYYPVFVASLVWNNHSLRIYVADGSGLAEQEMLKMNYIISFSEFESKVIRGPEVVGGL